VLVAAALALEGPSAPAEPAGAPARIAYGADSDIYTIAADGSDRQRLTTIAGGHESTDPDWAPDGRSIAFVRDASVHGSADDEDENEINRSQIWVMAPDGSAQRPFAPVSPDNAYDGSPAWAPDGTRLAFARTRSGQRHSRSSLIVTGADGAGRHTVVPAEKNDLLSLGSIDWSPDGSTILYTRTTLADNGYFHPALYSVPAAGGLPHRIAREAGEPAWSPDGRRIAFIGVGDHNGTRCPGDECSYAGELYVMNADGSGRTRLTNGKGDERAPSWSSDGRRIAFQSDRNYPDGEKPELYSIAPDGSCMTWLTNGSTRSAFPSWEPGAGSTDPGACGDAGRPALAETDTAALTSAHDFPVYWLGPETDSGLLLDYANSYEGHVELTYGDCSRYEPAECPAPINLSEESACESRPLFQAGYQTELVTRIGGGGLLYVDRKAGDFPELYAGPTRVSMFPEHNAQAGSIVAALRQANGGSEPGQLPLAQLPVSFWRRIERASAARRKYGTAGAARRLRLSRGALKERTSIHRRLRELGPFGRLRCG
jgi:Tol biopolymer transport system component